MKRLFEGPLLPAVLAAVALTVALAPGRQRDDGGSGAQHRTPGTRRVDRLELLGDLARGEQIAGWSVEALDAGPDKRAEISVSRDGVSFRILLVPRGEEPHPAPRSTRTRDLFYTRPTPPTASISTTDRDGVLAALASRIAANE